MIIVVCVVGSGSKWHMPKVYYIHDKGMAGNMTTDEETCLHGELQGVVAGCDYD